MIQKRGVFVQFYAPWGLPSGGKKELFARVPGTVLSYTQSTAERGIEQHLIKGKEIEQLVYRSQSLAQANG